MKSYLKRHWPRILLAVAIGAMVPIILTQNEQSTLEARMNRCADIHQSAKIAQLNYLLGKDKEDALLSRPIFVENWDTYGTAVDAIYSQDYQPHPVIKEALTSLIVSEAYFDCIREYVPEIGDPLNDN